MFVKCDHADHIPNIMKSFVTFFEKEDYLDVTFVCRNGKNVKGNKLVLSGVSPLLKLLFSEWEGNPEMITLLLPDVDNKILKLVLDFMYEGSMKLNGTELKDFKAVLKMLDIRFPGSSVSERSVEDPPPAEKLQKKPANIIENRVERTVGLHLKESPSGRGNSNPRDDAAGTRNDPDDDPLNVPDYYFTPSTSTRVSEASNDKEKNPEMNPLGQQLCEQSTLPTALQFNIDGQQIPESHGHNRNLPRNHGGVTTRKRSYQLSSDNSNNSATDASSTEQGGKKCVKMQSFTYVKEDSLDLMVNDTVPNNTHSQRTKSRKT